MDDTDCISTVMFIPYLISCGEYDVKTLHPETSAETVFVTVNCSILWAKSSTLYLMTFERGEESNTSRESMDQSFKCASIYTKSPFSL